MKKIESLRNWQVLAIIVVVIAAVIVGVQLFNRYRMGQALKLPPKSNAGLIVGPRIGPEPSAQAPASTQPVVVQQPQPNPVVEAPPKPVARVTVQRSAPRPTQTRPSSSRQVVRTMTERLTPPARRVELNESSRNTDEVVAAITKAVLAAEARHISEIREVIDVRAPAPKPKKRSVWSKIGHGIVAPFKLIAKPFKGPKVLHDNRNRK